MLKGKIKILVAFILVFSLFSSMMLVSSAASNIKLKMDGHLLSVTVPPMYYQLETFVPADDVFQALGASIQKTAGTKEVTYTTADYTIVLKPFSNIALVNGVQKKLKAETKVVKNKLLVPTSFLTSTLGASVTLTKSSAGKVTSININYFTKMSGTLKIGGSTTVLPIAQGAADVLNDLNDGKVSITVAGGGSGKGITGALDGTFNIGMSSDELSKADLDKGLTEYKIGKDGIVVVLNPANPVKNLTKQQVIDIFTGKVTNWKDVGGSNAAIFIQTREAGSGTLKAFMSLALGGKTISDTATPSVSNPMLLQAVSSNKNAIGFLSMGFVDSKVKAVNVDGIAPTRSNAISGKWPYIRPILVMTKGQAKGLSAKFINYLTSSDGQDMIAEEGYLPLNAKD